jgi:hypothetical protein
VRALRQLSIGFRRVVKAVSRREPSRATTSSTSANGARVEHARFGAGTVEGSRDGTVTGVFDRAGTKTIDAGWLRPRGSEGLPDAGADAEDAGRPLPRDEARSGRRAFDVPSAA